MDTNFDKNGAEMVPLSSSEDKNGPPSKSKRQVFSSQLDFIMLAIGGVVGLGNIWRFPFLCYKNGGGAFLIPYFVSYILVATPVYLLEIALGQYTTNGCVNAWNIVPVFKGIGYASQLIIFYATVCYNLILGWAVYYLAMSLTTTDLPWATCCNAWNTDRCFVQDVTMNNTIRANCSLASTYPINTTDIGNTTLRKDAVEEFFEYNVLKVSEGIDHPGEIIPHIAVSNLVAWIVVYACVCQGVKWSGKIAYFTALFPYVIITILTIRGVTLDGAADGLKFYLKPNFTMLLDSQVWVDAGSQVMFSLGVGLGFPIMSGSYNKFRTNCIRNGMIVVIANCLTSIYGGIAVFSVLGFMAKHMGTSIDQVVKSGPGLVFIAYPKALTQMPVAPLWSALFFIMIIIVGLDTQFLGVESFMTPIIDAFPETLNRTRNRMIVVGVFCAACFLLSLPMVREGGIYVFRLMDYYACNGLNLLLICLAESLVIGWVFGADKFYDALELMTGKRYSPYLKICWRYVAPIVVIGIFIFNVTQLKPLKYGDTYEYPLWSTIIGVLFMLSSTLCIPVTFGVFCLKSSGSIKQRWQDVTSSELNEHQIHPKWLENGSYRLQAVLTKTNGPFDENIRM